MRLPVPDLIVFFLLMAVNIFIGVFFYFRNKTPGDFTAGGRRIPAWVAGMSIFATFVSSISFLGLPGKAFMSDWNAFVFSLSIPFAAILTVKFFVPHYRAIGNISAYYYLEQRFGRWARIYASVCYILTQLMRTGAILMLLAIPLNTLFGWNIKSVIILTGLLVTAYSMLGGIKAVMWTDAIQGIILIAGAVVCSLFLVFSMPEGPRQLFEIATANNKFSLGSFGTSLSESTFWIVLVYGLFINLQNYGIDQNYIQRYMTTSTDREAKRSALFGSLLYIPVSLLFFFIGTGLFSYYTSQPGLLPGEYLLPGAGDKVFPYFIVTALPPGLTGLLIAAIFAAGMSTVSTSLNSTSTIILTDYYKRYFKKEAGEKESMKVLYVSSALMGISGIAIAIALIGVESILDAWWSLASIFSGGMLGLFLLGFVSAKTSKPAAITGVIAGVCLIIWMSLSTHSPFHTNLTIVLGTFTIFLVGFLFTIIFKKNEK